MQSQELVRVLHRLPNGARVRITDSLGRNYVWIARGMPVGPDEVRRYVEDTAGASWYISARWASLVDIQVLSMPSGDSEN